MSPLVTGVAVRNYKSLAQCRVALGRLTFLVGPNGSGKSNFLDALRFVSDALNTTLENALRERGGIRAVRRHSRGHPTHFGIRIEVDLGRGDHAWYGFKVGAVPDGGFVVQREECRVNTSEHGKQFFVVEAGQVTHASSSVRSVLEPDRLALVTLSGMPEFRPLYDVLRRMGFYNLNPQTIRELQDPDPGQLLRRDASNLAAVVRELGRGDGPVLRDVCEHLQAVAPGITAVAHRAVGPKETIEFSQQVKGDEHPWHFLAENMSDGTLRALAVLVAVFQRGRNGQPGVPLVGIEEPELALHPGATGVIGTALILASQRIQVLATTHSPDLLDHKELTEEHLLAVSADRGETLVGPVDAATRSVLRDRLYSPGELLSQGRLEPDADAAREASNQLSLFSGGED